MAGTQAVWGIDLGRCALKAVRVRASAEDKDTVEIIGHEYIEHAKVLSQPDADRGELIRSALEKFLAHHDLSKDLVVVSVPGQHTLARFTKLPPVAPKRIPDIVRYEADQQIPFDMDEVIWDYQTFQQEGSPDLEVGIFAMKRELVREHLLHFEQAAIEPIIVQPTPLAVYNAAQFDGMLGKETTILLDVGAENTDLIIGTPDAFWTRTVSIGGNSFTDALVKSFKLAFAKAETLKRTADTSKYARQIFQAMRPVFADLVQELQRSVGFYSASHRDSHVTKVVCMGNAFKLPGLQKYLQQNLGLPVERPETFKRAAPTGPASSPEFKEQLLGYGVAYGLALQGLDLAKVKSNLLPTELAKQVVWRKKRPWFGAAAACLLLAGGAVWFRASADARVLAAIQGGAAAPKNAEDAWTVISNGPNASLSERAQADAVLQAGLFLKKELGTLTNQGVEERKQLEQLIQWQQNKTLVARILQVVHESVPTPDGPLANAHTQTDILKAIESGAPARPDRKQLFIDRLTTRFDPNLNSVQWASLVPVPQPINNPEAELAGIKIEIACRSPNHEGLAFISRGFMDNLRKNGRKAGLGFYFDRVILFDGGKVEGGRGPGPGGPGRAGGPKPPPRPGTSPVPLPTGITTAVSGPLDPVTNEPIDTDWRFVIWVDAILGDFPGGGEEAGSPEGGG